MNCFAVPCLMTLQLQIVLVTHTFGSDLHVGQTLTGVCRRIFYTNALASTAPPPPAAAGAGGPELSIVFSCYAV